MQLYVRTEKAFWCCKILIAIESFQREVWLSSTGVQVQSGWPFLINADFLLTASRESIAFGTPWNQGLLGCARAAFVEGYLEIQVGRSAEGRKSRKAFSDFLPAFGLCFE
jgi:hypothetical protein